jgi:Na+/phosphate symporter
MRRYASGEHRAFGRCFPDSDLSPPLYVITVSIGLVFANQLAAAGQWLAFGSDNVGRQIANAHVLFNVTGALAFVGLVPMVAKLLERLIPARRSRAEVLAQGQAAH